MGDKARWETNWETSPARRTQHPTQGERQSQVGDKLGDRRQALRGGHSTPAKADTLKTALRTPTVNCLGKKTKKNKNFRLYVGLTGIDELVFESFDFF